MGDKIFDVTAPYVGRVVLLEETWTTHILDKHEEMEGMESTVQMVVEDPTHISESYLGSYLLTSTDVAHPLSPGRFLRVVVHPKHAFYKVTTSVYSSVITPPNASLVWTK